MAITSSDLIQTVKPWVIKWIQDYGVSGMGGAASVIGTSSIVPTTITLASINSYTPAALSHAIATSSAPGAAASILATDVSGYLSLVRLTLSDRLRAPTLDTASGAMTIQPASDLVLSPGSNLIKLSSGKSLQSDNFVAQTTGMQINYAGQADFRFVFATQVRTPLIDTAAGSLTLQPASDLLLSPGSNLVKLSSGKVLQSDNYASQTTGMRITRDGQADFRYLYTDELHAKSFIADLEQALAGGQIITPSVTLLYANFNVPNAGSSATFIVRDLPSATGMQVFPNRDIVRFRSFSRSAGSLTIGDAWGEVVLDTSYGTSGFDSATKTQRYTFYRYSGLTIADTTNDPITDTTGDPILASNVSTPQGGMAGGTTVYADSIILDYGKNFGGYHETTTVDGVYGANSPYSQIVSWTLHPKNTTLRTRLGNLVGVFSVSGEYGLFAGFGTSTSDSYIRASSEGILLNNTPLALYSSGTQRVNIDATGANVWFSSDGGTTKQLYWNGSALALTNASLALFTGSSQRVNIDAAGADVWFSSDGGTTKQLSWNGSTLALTNASIALFTGSSQRVNIDAAGANVWFSSNGGTTKPLYWNGSALTFNNATAVFVGTATMTISSGGIFATTATSAPAFTTVTATTTVNGESLSTGSTLLGDNSSGKGNVLFDQSTGALKIRSGMNDYFSFGASGKIEGIFTLGTSGEIRQGTGTFGSSFTGLRLFLGSGGGAGTNGSGIIDMWNANDISVRLDPGDGVIIRAGTGFASDKALNFRTSTGARTGEVYGYTDLSTYRAVRLRGWSDSATQAAYGYVTADNESSTGKAYVILQAARLTAPSTYPNPLASLNGFSDANLNKATFQVYAASTSESTQIFGTVTNTTSEIDYIADDHYWTGTKHGFYIDHPLHPLTMTLSHTPLETDALRTFYDGTVVCDKNGAANVTALNKVVRYQLTCVGGWAQVTVMESAANATTAGGIAGKHEFQITGGYEGLRVDWQVTGLRRDAWARYHPFAPERMKEGEKRGKLLKAKARHRGDEFQWMGAPPRPANRAASPTA